MNEIEDLKRTVELAAKQYKDKRKRLKDAVKESKERQQTQTG